MARKDIPLFLAKGEVPFFRTEFNYDRDAASLEHSLSMVNPETGELDTGATQQEFAEECDINTIVKRFGLTGELPENPRVPQSGDFTGVTDYQSALNAVMEADAAFMEFPGEVRARFNNDPQQLLEFVSDSRNRDEAVKLGLVKKPVEASVPPQATPPQAPA